MYKPLRKDNWAVYAYLRKVDPIAAKKFKIKVLKEPRVYCHESYDPYDYFDNQPIIWKPFRIADEDYNSYDCRTEITTIMSRLSEEDEREFREYFWVHYRDPYGDGRDCTGAPFTGWMKFLRCKDRTIIIHKVNYDV